MFCFCQPLWRFTERPADGRLLVYRSEDIKNISRLSSPKVCGYVNADAQELLPEEAKAAGQTEQEEGVYLQLNGLVLEIWLYRPLLMSLL